MKAEITENGVRLIAETPHEERALKLLKEKGVGRLTFADEWNGEGPLEVQHPDPWERK